MNRDEIEEARTNLKLILDTLADAGVMMGKPAEDVAALRTIAPLAIDVLCDQALKALRPEARDTMPGLEAATEFFAACASETFTRSEVLWELHRLIEDEGKP